MVALGPPIDSIELTKSELDALYKACSLWFPLFPQVASGNQDPEHIHYIAERIQKAIEAPPADKYRLLLISCPCRHGKTELISKHLPAWIGGRYPEKKIILTSYGSELAQDNSAVAKEIFAQWGPRLFGVGPNKRRFKKYAWYTERGGGIRASGVGGPITGFGADIFLIDDYVKGYEEAESAGQREKIWSWWQSVAGTRLHPGAVVIILATRWHTDDLIGRLLRQRQEEGDDFPFEVEEINLPAIAHEGDLLGRNPGDALWPARYNLARLLNIKRLVGPYWWSALYDCSPTSRGGTLFKSDYFRYYTFDALRAVYLCFRVNEDKPIEVRKTELTRHVYVDPAIEIKKVNDPTGLQAWGYSRRHRVWLLLDRLNDRIEHTRVLPTIRNFAFKNMCTLVGVEDEKLGKVIVKQSEGRDEIGGMKIPFREIPTRGLDKYTRAVPMATYMENERVFFPRGAPWLAEFESSLVNFPNTGHDEDVDLISMAQHMESRKSVADILAGR
ncbi:MAG: phage terminase large subunit [bacterium]